MSASRSLCCWRFAQDMFPGVSTEDIGVWPADDGELVVSVFAERLQRIEKCRRADPRCLCGWVRSRRVTRRGGTSRLHDDPSTRADRKAPRDEIARGARLRCDELY